MVLSVVVAVAVAVGVDVAVAVAVAAAAVAVAVVAVATADAVVAAVVVAVAVDVAVAVVLRAFWPLESTNSCFTLYPSFGGQITWTLSGVIVVLFIRNERGGVAGGALMYRKKKWSFQGRKTEARVSVVHPSCCTSRSVKRS